MAFNKRIMFKKLPRFLRRLLRMLGMVPKPPKIDGLFTEHGQRNSVMIPSVNLWYRTWIRDNPVTLDCPVVEVGWYKKQNGVKHEFIRFDISSPDNVHTSIVIAERVASTLNPDRDPSGATQPTNTITPSVIPTDPVIGPDTSPDVAGDSTASSADESSPYTDKATETNGKTKRKARRPPHIASISSRSQRDANDSVDYATLESPASAALERKCEKATRICTLTFSEKVRPSANELATLLDVVSKHEPMYSITNTQCYWFVETVFDALKSLFAGAAQDPASHQGGTWNRVPIPTKGGSVEVVCAKYRAARAALAEEAEQKRRAEQQQEEERQRERQVAEERARAAEERARAAEEERQRERQVAEERARAAEEERQRERQVAEERARAAEEEIAKLRRELEAARAGAST